MFAWEWSRFVGDTEIVGGFMVYVWQGDRWPGLLLREDPNVAGMAAMRRGVWKV